MKKTILLTGGAGFIGSNFVHHIWNRYPDYKILVLDLLTYAGNPENFPVQGTRDPRFEFWYGDVCNAELVDTLVSKSDFVVHFAAESHVTRSIYDNHTFFQTDVMGTHAVANAVLKYRKKVGRFIHISTSEVYGTAEGDLMDEDHPLKPLSPYASAKCGADRLVYSYFRTYKIPAVIVRPFNNYGPRQHLEKLVPRFITSVLLKEPLSIHGDGSAARDFIFVQDNCEAIDLLLHAPAENVEGEIFNIGSGVHRNIRQIAHDIRAIVSPDFPGETIIPDRPGQVFATLPTGKKSMTGWGGVPKPTGKGGCERPMNGIKTTALGGKTDLDEAYPHPSGRWLTGDALKKIPFYRHNLGEEEIREIRKVLRGPILTTGAKVTEFEKRFSNFLGCRDTVACTSWTGAAHIAFLALGLKPGDEVIISPLTFVATATAIIQAGGIPRFVDCEKNTGNIDPDKIQTAITKKTKFIMPVHLYGRMCDMKKIMRIAKKYKLKVIEDAAHCIEGSRNGIRPAQISDAACFSFFATKNIACGEGGAVSFNNPSLSKKLRRLRLHGITKTSVDREKEGYSHWDMPSFGWKYNLDNIHGAILCAQIKKFKSAITKRKHLYSFYKNKIESIIGIKLFKDEKNEIHARHLFPILVNEKRRNSIIKSLEKNGIRTMVNYRPIHKLKYFHMQKRYKKLRFLNAEKLEIQYYPYHFIQQ